jgi:hypothetical protein
MRVTRGTTHERTVANTQPWQAPGRAACRALLLVICAALYAPIAVADSDHELARKLRESGEILSLEQIVERARAVKPGEIIETELDRKQGRYVYEVEILDSAGQVWEVELDAKTGELLEIEQDD